jgi:cyclohexa-1,5-dienecarbonyl-CoA hydratase
MGYATIDFYPGPRVVSIVLNRPPLNIVNLEMMDELNAALDEASDLNAQIVVFSGTGDRAFSAGVDVRDHTPEKVEMMLTKFHCIIERIRESDVRAVAAIHGHTLGGGAGISRESGGPAQSIGNGDARQTNHRPGSSGHWIGEQGCRSTTGP